jgi:surface carbohydrate biosynthesis protein (TIGR04326 family)
LNKKLHIWDSQDTPGKINSWILYWGHHPSTKNLNEFSIVEHVENHSDKYKNVYLKWIYNLGEFELDNKSIVEHFTIREGFSYWWATSIAQKFNCSDISEINNAIKVLALEDYIRVNNISEIELSSDDLNLFTVISRFCSKQDIPFKFNKIKITRKNFQKYHPRNYTPYFFKAFLFLATYFLKSLPLYFARTSDKKENIGQITLIDVLAHLDIQNSKNDRFHSNYWTLLIEKIHDLGLKTNWVHQFFVNPQVNTLSKANNIVNKFTIASKYREIHQLLNKPLTLEIIRAVITDYIKIRKSYKKLKTIYSVKPYGYDVDLWPFHIKEWQNSLLGSPVIDTCLKLYFFKDTFRSISKQRLGIYISENQPWEMALIHAWKYHGHGKLVGVPHTTIRYWDLRYFYYSPSYSLKKVNQTPLPDILAVNSPVAYKLMIDSDYPKERLIKVEALRYLHLIKRKRNLKARSKKAIRILFCGDYISKNNDLMLTWLDIASKIFDNNTVFIFKPHPAYKYSLKNSVSNRIKISHQKIEHLLSDCDIVITGNITSAAVDAYCYGIHVIQIWDGASPNLSPLRGCLDVIFVRDLHEMIQAIKNLKIGINKSKQYFFLDKSLKQWTLLLADE